MNLKHFLTSYTKINSKGLNVRPETIKLRRKHGQNTRRHKARSFMTHLLEKIKTKVNKWDLVKLKSFCTEREI